MRLSKSTKRHFRQLFCLLAAVSVIVLFVVGYANLENAPTWDDLYRFLGLISDSPDSKDFVSVLDVGQGDCVLVSSNRKSFLVDSGTPENPEELCDKLAKNGIVDFGAVLLTHFHNDHYGGMTSVLSRFKTENLILPDLLKTDENVTNIVTFKTIAEMGGTQSHTAKSGMNFKVGDFDVTIVAYYPFEEEENNRSVVTMLRKDNTKILLTGDAEASAEEQMISDTLALDCDVLKVGHHGSSGATTDRFLRATTPKYAAISCGKGNKYSHPHEALIARLDSYDTAIFRTDISGDITFYIEDNNIAVETEY